MSPLDRRRRSVIPKVVGVVAASAVIGLLVGGLLDVGRASAPYRREVNRGYVSMASSVVTASNETGKGFDTLFAQVSGMERMPLSAQLEDIVNTAELELRTASSLSPPTPTNGLGPRFVTVMETRAAAASDLEKTIDELLGLTAPQIAETPGVPKESRGSGGGTSTATTPAHAMTNLSEIGRRLAQSDRVYAAIRRSFRMGPGSALLPKSQWISDPGAWTPSSIAALVGAIESSSSLAPFERTVLLPQTLQLSPEPVPSPAPANAQSTTLEVIPTKKVTVTVVVANQGNVMQRGVTVSFVMAPVGTSGPATKRTWKRAIFNPGTSEAVTFPRVPVRAGRTYQVTVSVKPPPGQGDPTDTTLTFTVKVATAPPPPTTTTTTTHRTTHRTTKTIHPTRKGPS